MASPVTTVWTDTPGGKGSVPSSSAPEAGPEALDALETPRANSASALTTRTSAKAQREF
jgi:hypothetical protein